LLGVGVANLLRGELQQQLSFDDALAGMRDDPMRRNLSGAAIDAADAEWDATNSAVDAIRNKFGAELIGPARLAGQAKQAQGQQWGPAAEHDADEASKPVVLPPADAG